MLISIVIPVYNVEKYISECIESIINQEFKNYEIILVDDGSSDKSGEICDYYAQKYDFINVIHKENGGHSSARNCGLMLAKGEYIAFIDSDDLVFEESIKKIAVKLKYMNKPDLVFLHGFKLYENGKKVDFNDDVEEEYVNGKSKKEVCVYLGGRPKYPGSACTKLFKKDFLKKNNIVFPTDLTHAEDLLFTMSCIIKAESYAAVDVPYYLYRQNRKGSMTNKISESSLNGLNEFVIRSIGMLDTEKSNIEYEIYESLMSYVAYGYCNLLWGYARCNKKNNKEILQSLKDNKWVLKYGNTIQIKGINIIQQLLGIQITGEIITLIKKFQKRITMLH